MVRNMLRFFDCLCQCVYFFNNGCVIFLMFLLVAFSFAVTPVTTIGRMLVMGTVLAGATIIPLQVTGAVEALLDFRRDVDASHHKNVKRKKKVDMSNDDDFEEESDNDNHEHAYEFQPILGTNGKLKHIKTNVLTVCPVCKAKPHHSKSSYCWNCGSPLWTAIRPISFSASSRQQQQQQQQPYLETRDDDASFDVVYET
jgi:ribosomal protein L37E